MTLSPYATNGLRLCEVEILGHPIYEVFEDAYLPEHNLDLESLSDATQALACHHVCRDATEDNTNQGSCPTDMDFNSGKFADAICATEATCKTLCENELQCAVAWEKSR